MQPPMMLVGEEEEIVQWCKDMVECGHKLEMIQLKSHVPPLCQGRTNNFQDGVLNKLW
jgi:hypothetical protein